MALYISSCRWKLRRCFLGGSLRTVPRKPVLCEPYHFPPFLTESLAPYLEAQEPTCKQEDKRNQTKNGEAGSSEAELDRLAVSVNQNWLSAVSCGSVS